MGLIDKGSNPELAVASVDTYARCITTAGLVVRGSTRCDILYTMYIYIYIYTPYYDVTNVAHNIFPV